MFVDLISITQHHDAETPDAALVAFSQSSTAPSHAEILAWDENRCHPVQCSAHAGNLSLSAYLHKRHFEVITESLNERQTLDSWTRQPVIPQGSPSSIRYGGNSHITKDIIAGVFFPSPGIANHLLLWWGDTEIANILPHLLNLNHDTFDLIQLRAEQLSQLTTASLCFTLEGISSKQKNYLRQIKTFWV